jgi:hypothetical protein
MPSVDERFWRSSQVAPAGYERARKVFGTYIVCHSRWVNLLVYTVSSFCAEERIRMRVQNCHVMRQLS